MPRLLAVIAVLALLVPAGAGADHLDPTKRLRAADQARARAMLLRLSDLPPGYERETTTGLDPHVTCAALDLSDLTLTGLAESPWWERDFRLVSSAASVYVSPRDSSRAWARTTSAAGIRCARDALARELAQGGNVRVSSTQVPFPRVAERTVAYRMTITPADTSGLSVTVDVVSLKQGRALTGLAFVSVLQPPERALQVRLARTVGARMKAVMRGA